MKLQNLFSRLAANRLENQARHLRRALRDHTRHENQRIQTLENRVRGLRLYAAWSRKPVVTAQSAWPVLKAPALA